MKRDKRDDIAEQTVRENEQEMFNAMKFLVGMLLKINAESFETELEVMDGNKYKISVKKIEGGKS